MKMYSRLLEPTLTRQLETAGILTGDANQAATAQPTPPGLLIKQFGGVSEGRAFDLDCGYGTGVTINLHIAVDRRPLKIWGWRLDFPWEDPQFQWLTDPSESDFPDGMYQFPGCPTLKYPRDGILNHRRLVRPAHGLDGSLLGYGFESIPDSYRHNAMIDASLVLIDEMMRECPTRIQLWADRSNKHNRQAVKKSTRPRLFEKPDKIKGVLTRK
jgi:hypothetical protein